MVMVSLFYQGGKRLFGAFYEMMKYYIFYFPTEIVPLKVPHRCIQLTMVDVKI